MGAEVKIEGFDELARKLREIAPAMRKKVLRNALAAGGRLVRDEAKRNAPVLQLKNATPLRTAGTLKKALSVRTSKTARRAGDVGVFVNVRPAKAGQRGAKNPRDPFYWRFQEFGTRKMRAANGQGFLRPAANKLGAALEIFKTQVGRWLEKVNESGKVVP